MPPDDPRRHRRVQRPEPITSAGNQVVRLLRSLERRKGREATGQFVAEGERVVADAIVGGVQPHAIVVRDGYVPSSRVLADSLANASDRLRVLETGLFDTVVSTIHSQGILAILPLPERLALPEDASLVVLLDGIRDPGNMGTLLRTSAAAGAGAVVIGAGSVDVYNAKVVRSAMGAHFRVPIIPIDAVDEARLAAFPLRAVAEADAEATYDRLDWRQPALLIVGSEANGPGAAGRALANTAVAIPMAAGVESLNAAVAGAVILFEISRQRRVGP